MGAMATVQVQVDAAVERRATEALKAEGLTIEQALLLMLERTAENGVLPFPRNDFRYLEPGEDAEYDDWVRAKVQEALDDPRPPLSAEEARQRMRAFRREVAESVGAK